MTTTTSLATSSSFVSSIEDAATTTSEAAPLTPSRASNNHHHEKNNNNSDKRTPPSHRPNMPSSGNNRSSGDTTSNSDHNHYLQNSFGGSSDHNNNNNSKNNNNFNNININQLQTGALVPTGKSHPHHHNQHLHLHSCSSISNSGNQPDVSLCCGQLLGQEDGQTSATTVSMSTNASSNAPILASSHRPILTTKSGAELIPLPPDSSTCVIDEIYDSAAAAEDQAENGGNNNNNCNGGNNNNNGAGDNDSSASTESRYVVPPDGGWGWVVVFASFVICFIVDSVAYSYPMIYANLTSLTMEGPVAFFIGATLMALYMITAPFASALVNVYGTRRVIVLGSILTSTGLIVSSRTTQNDFYWLILTFGVMGGVGLGMMYIGAMVSVGTYFDKRRPLALALAVCGSGLGMGIFPLVAHHLFDHFGLGPALELYACFVLQGAWLGMLVWPLPPRPLYACAKPRRKDLLDRVTEWVDKMRHRSDSLDSLADPETIAERNKMVREAAHYRIEGLRRFESGLATPPTTPGSSLSLATTVTPPASRVQSFVIPEGGGDRQIPDGDEPDYVGAVTFGGIQFRRCTSIAICRSPGYSASTRSCPQLSSLIWTPHASHALIRQSDEPPPSLLHRRRRAPREDGAASSDAPVLPEETDAPNNLQPSCSSRSTSGVVCELADLGDQGNVNNINNNNNNNRFEEDLDDPTRTQQSFLNNDNDNNNIDKASAQNNNENALPISSAPHRSALVNRNYQRPPNQPDPGAAPAHYRSHRDHRRLIPSAHTRAHPGLTTGTTVTSSSSDFAILAASKPMPLLSAGCCVCVKKALEQSLDISLLKDSRFWILAIGNIAAMMGLYQIIFVLPALAAYADNNDSQHITSVIMAVFGVTHTIGRVLTGVMSGPRFRPLLLCNTAFVLSMAVFAVFAIAQEPLTYPVLCALAALHGLCYAFFAVLSTVIIVNVFGVRKLSSCFGMITLARGLAPYLTTLAYQLAYLIGTNSNIFGGSAASESSGESSSSPDSSGSSDPSSDPGDNNGGGGGTGPGMEATRYVQRAYGVAGIIYVGIAFTFHLLLHFRYFKRRLLDVQRKPRTRLRCVSVPTPSSLSGYRLPNGGRSIGGLNDDEDDAGLQIAAEEEAAALGGKTSELTRQANQAAPSSQEQPQTHQHPHLQLLPVQVPSAILTPIDDENNDNNNNNIIKDHHDQPENCVKTSSSQKPSSS